MNKIIKINVSIRTNLVSHDGGRENGRVTCGGGEGREPGEGGEGRAGKVWWWRGRVVGGCF